MWTCLFFRNITTLTLPKPITTVAMGIATKLTEWAGDTQKWVHDVAANPKSLLGDVLPEEFYLATEEEKKSPPVNTEKGTEKPEAPQEDHPPISPEEWQEVLRKCYRYEHGVPTPTKFKRSKPKPPTPAPKQEKCGGVKDQQEYEAKKTELDNAINPALDSFKMVQDALIRERDRPIKHLYHPLIAVFDFAKKSLQQNELQEAIDTLEAAEKALEESRQKALEELQKKHCLK